jgi:LPXTG-site transpeptidase (sortase) family protein
MSKVTKKPQPVSKEELVRLYRRALQENLPLDKIDTKVTKLWHRSQVTADIEIADTMEYESELKHKIPAIVRYGAMLLPVAFISVGLFLLGNAVIPIAAYYVDKVPQLAQNELTAPIPHTDVLDTIPTVIAEAKSSGIAKSSLPLYAAPTIIDAQLDYTNLANWFDEAQVATLIGGDSREGTMAEYILDIPSLDIENAKVVIGGTDLNSSLIQYPGTANPGEAGAPVIFGHSVLRQFYNPSLKNPRRYTSLFSKIMTLKPGDDIFVTEGNTKFQYKVKDKTEVKPEDVYILTQNYDQKSLKLVTCTPEGTYLRRGVVSAELVSS